MKVTGTYSGTVTLADGITAEYTCDCQAEWYHQNGRMYMPNGDPGYPEEDDIEDIECTDIIEVEFKKEDGSYLEDEEIFDYYDEHESELYQLIDSDIQYADIDWEAADD